MVSDRAIQIDLQPSVLRWARERSHLDPDELARKIAVRVERVPAWEETGRISLAQIGRLAARTHTPEGFLFLQAPPEDRLEIPDLRTVGDRPAGPSPDLLDTVHAMQRRQAWMREELIEQGADPLPFVGRASSSDPIEDVAASMRQALDLASGWARRCRLGSRHSASFNGEPTTGVSSSSQTASSATTPTAPSTRMSSAVSRWSTSTRH